MQSVMTDDVDLRAFAIYLERARGEVKPSVTHAMLGRYRRFSEG